MKIKFSEIEEGQLFELDVPNGMLYKKLAEDGAENLSNGAYTEIKQDLVVIPVIPAKGN